MLTAIKTYWKAGVGILIAALLAALEIFRLRAKAAENALDAVESESKARSLETQKDASDAARDAGMEYQEKIDEITKDPNRRTYRGMGE